MADRTWITGTVKLLFDVLLVRVLQEVLEWEDDLAADRSTK